MDIPITGIKLCGVKEPEKLKGNVVTLLYAKSVRPGGNDSLQFPGYQAWYQGDKKLRRAVDKGINSIVKAVR